MDKLLWLIAGMVLLQPGQALALTATTVDNNIACVNKEALNEMNQFALSKDKSSFVAYIQSGKCIVMKGGMNVTVIDSPGVFGQTTMFIYKGNKLWTSRNGLRNYRAE